MSAAPVNPPPPAGPGGPDVVVVGPGPLTPGEVLAVARAGARVELADEALTFIARGRAVVEDLADRPEAHYGVSTGLGALATTPIDPEDQARLQLNVLRSHAAGAGPEIERDVVRAMMLLRLSTMATGHTGVRPLLARAVADLLNAGLTPLVPEFGSLGCSGDLAPLAHCALALLGEGTVRDRAGTEQEAEGALRAAGLTPVVPAAKEGLALVNGTEGMLALLLLAAEDLDLLLGGADIVAAMSVEALLGTDAAFADDLQALRPHPGALDTARTLRRALAGSPIMASHRDASCHEVQDAYSLRCVPAVHGAARDALDFARLVAGRELAAAIDNPVITWDGQMRSTGSFHGAPLAHVLDLLAVVVADVAAMAERRTDRHLDPARSRGLPAFLADRPGVDSGLMLAHYTQAALVTDLRRLAVPASVDSIPVSAMQEDHVSLGWSSGRKLRRALDGLATILGIELLVAARSLDLRAPLVPAPATAAVRAALRAEVPGPGPDRPVAPEIEAAARFVREGRPAASASSRPP
ncbi:histidine ammonia-lyase [Actinomycetospora lutea]|uniref:histidine ammonia-lyase n=1 Tax=Actinomycetospora lutea TaxID=663604 RepID=UPI002366D59C|nr:histidine ammonia-lyase [Actinomycetospora lutea]MDD7942434.1 histidine ammonia-lyase [Actinomycetospora lutea]